MFASNRGNLFAGNLVQFKDEFFECILKHGGIEVERFVSKGQSTPTDAWYDQDWDEWVLLVQGEAILLIRDDHQRLHLKPGDYVMLPAHCHHRVEWTHPAIETVWLAIHWR